MYTKEEFESKVKDYYQLKEQIAVSKSKLDILNKEIKDYLILNKANSLHLFPYYIKLETKYTVSRDFILLLKDKNLNNLINEDCTLPNFRKACNLLKLNNNDRKKYLIKKETQWLFITKDD